MKRRRGYQISAIGQYFVLTIIFCFVSSIVHAQVPTISGFTANGVGITSTTPGNTITIVGNNFTGTTSVKFGTTNASRFTVIDNNSISASLACGTVAGNNTVTVTNATGTGSRTMSVVATVAQPGIITGNINIAGVNTQNYSISKVTNATSYTWAIGTGSSPNIITSINGAGNNDTSVTVTFAPNFCRNDTLIVRAATACTTSVARTLILTTTNRPPAPTGITSSVSLSSICIGQRATLTASPGVPTSLQSNTSRYRWTRPTNTSIISSNADSSQIVLSINNGFTGTGSGASIRVNAVNACTAVSSFGVTATISYTPAPVLNITSSTNSYNACVGSTINYTAVSATSLTYTPRATARYRWTIPLNTRILRANSDSSTITLTFNPGYTGNVKLIVAPQTACQIASGQLGSSRSVTLYRGSCPTPPASVTGPQELCPLFDPNTARTDTLTYTATPVAGITRYDWVLPTGAQQVSGGTNNSIGVVFDTSVRNTFGAGILYVGSISDSGVRSSTYTSYRVYKTKPLLGGITGPDNVCPYIGVDTPITYSVVTPANASEFLWTPPTGATIFSGQGTNTVQLKFSPSFTSGTSVSVVAISSCGSNGPRTKLLKLGNATMPGYIQQSFIPNIPANRNVAGLSSVSLKIRKVLNAQSYNWSMSFGTNATITHLNASGPNDTAVIVNFISDYTKDTLKVSAATSCNVTAPRTLFLTAMNPPPVPLSITGQLNPCRNTTESYSVSFGAPSPSQAPINRFRWTIPSNSTINFANADSSSISLQFNNSFLGGYLYVRSVSPTGVISSPRAIILRRIAGSCLPGGKIAANSSITSSSERNDLLMYTEIYPNPSKTDFLANIKSQEKGNIILEVWDAAGRLLLQKITGANQSVKFGGTLEPGTYILRLLQGEKIYKTKIVKY